MKIKPYLIFTYVALFSQQGFTSLGDTYQQPASSSQAVQKTSTAGIANCYEVHAHQEDGINIKEFVDVQSRKIFLVTASGYKHANLQNLLGDNNFHDFQTAQKDPKSYAQHNSRNRRSATAVTANLKAHIGGTNRVKHSRAYLSNEVPSCVKNIEELQ